jgi:hypothetical protein
MKIYLLIIICFLNNYKFYTNNNLFITKYLKISLDFLIYYLFILIEFILINCGIDIIEFYWKYFIPLMITIIILYKNINNQNIIKIFINKLLEILKFYKNFIIYCCIVYKSFFIVVICIRYLLCCNIFGSTFCVEKSPGYILNKKFF